MSSPFQAALESITTFPTQESKLSSPNTSWADVAEEEGDSDQTDSSLDISVGENDHTAGHTPPAPKQPRSGVKVTPKELQPSPSLRISKQWEKEARPWPSPSPLRLSFQLPRRITNTHPANPSLHLQRPRLLHLSNLHPKGREMVNTELRVGLYNVRGVHPTPHSGPKLPSFLQWGKEVGCSLLALTETHTTNTYNPFTTPTFQKNYQVASSSCQTKTAGVALIALDKRATITPTISALDGRLLVATVTLPSLPNPIMVAVIYAPDSGKSTAKRRKFFNKCQRLIPREVDILLGDFNVTLRPEDSSAPRAPLAVLNAVEDLLSHLGLADIASEGAAHTFHWDKKKPKPGSARLDRVYAPVESFMAPTQLPTQDPGLSDHSPVLCSLLTGLTSQGFTPAKTQSGGDYSWPAPCIQHDCG